jgi:iron complex outermembrane recepter protein
MSAPLFGQLFGPIAAPIVALSVCVVAASAAAEPAQTPAARPQGSDEAARPATGVEEVVVTAARTKSLESKTPIAVSVIGGATLVNAGINDPSLLPQYVPNFSIDPGNANRITIRGVTSFDTSTKGDPSAAFLLDGVNIARSDDIDVTFYDIDRIEVLRGPQGTLFGRNSTAGVVDVISKRPIDAYEGAVNATVGNYGTVLADAMVNIPVNDVLALRASAAYDRRDNYLYPEAGDPDRLGLARNDVSGRLQGLVTFSPKATLLLKVDYRDWSPDSTQTSVLQTNFFNLNNPTQPIYVGGSSRAERTLTYDQAIAPAQHNHTWGVSGELNWDLGPLALTYLGSHRETALNQDFNFFFFVADGIVETDHHSQDSHELRLATTGAGPLRAQFGLYYFGETGSQVEDVPLAGSIFGELATLTKAQSYAAFGQATYDLAPGLHLTAGLRYTHDRKSQIGGSTIQAGPVFNPATDLLFESAATADFNNVSWRTGLDYDLNAATMLYASVSTGYKAGGFNAGCLAGNTFGGRPCNQPVPANVLFYRPETLTSYEVGAKYHGLDNRLRLNADAFYYDYTDLQLQSIVILNGNPSGQITNAAKARVDGVELEGSWVPSERHRLEATVTYLDASYLNYFPLGLGAPPSYAGKALDNSPHFTASIGYTYTQPIAGLGTVAFNAYSHYSADYVVSSLTVPVQFRQPAYTKTNLSLTYRPPAGNRYVQVFVKNLEDKIQITSAALESVNITEPRTFGLRAGAAF